jgi:Tfp pilus assembly protein PilF
MLNDLDKRQRSGGEKSRLDVVAVGRSVADAKRNRTLLLLPGILIAVLAAYFFWTGQADKQQLAVSESVESAEVVTKTPDEKTVNEKAAETAQENAHVSSSGDENSFRLIVEADKLRYKLNKASDKSITLHFENIKWPATTLNLPGWISGVQSTDLNAGTEVLISSPEPFHYVISFSGEQQQKILSLTLTRQQPKAEAAVVTKNDAGKKASSQTQALEKSTVEQTKREKPAIKNVKTMLSLSPAQLDKKTSVEAHQLIRIGKYEEAEKKLWQIVDGYPAARESRILLVTLLLGQQRLQLARQQLQAGLSYYPQDRSLQKLHARMVMAGGDLDSALAILNNMQINVPVDSEHVDLLAVVTQRSGDHQQALQLYHQLVQFDPGRAPWWVGLAISMEALGQASSARAAYLRASRLPIDNAALKDYIQVRLAALPATPESGKKP